MQIRWQTQCLLFLIGEYKQSSQKRVYAQPFKKCKVIKLTHSKKKMHVKLAKKWNTVPFRLATISKLDNTVIPGFEQKTSLIYGCRGYKLV